MIIIGLTQQVETDAEMQALTGLTDQTFIWHNGQNCPFMFRANASTGAIQCTSGGWFVKENFNGLNLSEHKDFRFEEINERSRELIANGHVYDSKVFSLSENAQRNLLGLFSSKDYLTYPLEYRTKDDLNKVYLNNSTDVTNFYFSAMGTIQHHLATGNALKEQIKNALTDLEVSQITDNR